MLPLLWAPFWVRHSPTIASCLCYSVFCRSTPTWSCLAHILAWTPCPWQQWCIRFWGLGRSSHCDRLLEYQLVSWHSGLLQVSSVKYTGRDFWTQHSILYFMSCAAGDVFNQIFMSLTTTIWLSMVFTCVLSFRCLPSWLFVRVFPCLLPF